MKTSMGKQRQKLEKTWLAGADHLFTLSQASHAFGLIADWFLSTNKSVCFWFPDYFCADALVHLRKSGARISFYPVDEKLNPDWKACAKLANSDHPDVFCIVHYFGEAADLSGARNFCQRNGALLFEDATHVYAPVGEIGKWGDLVCYSPRKFFSIPDGGILTVRGKELATGVADFAASGGKESPDATRWRLKKFERNIRRNMPGRKKKKPKPLPPIDQTGVRSRVPMFPQRWMSRYSEKQIARYSANSGIKAVTHEQFELMQALSAKFPNVKCLSVEVPHSRDAIFWIALRSPDHSSSLELLDWLRSNRIPASHWPQNLPAEVLETPAEHSIAIKLRNTTLRTPYFAGKLPRR